MPKYFKSNDIEPDKKLAKILSLDSIFKKIPKKSPNLVEEILQKTNFGKTLTLGKIKSNICDSDKVIGYKRMQSDPEVCKFAKISNTRSCPSVCITMSNAFPEILSKDATNETLNNKELEKPHSFIELKRQKLAGEESMNELNHLQISFDSTFPNHLKPRAFNLKDQDFSLKINFTLQPNIASSGMKEIIKLRDAYTSYDSMLINSEIDQIITKTIKSESKPNVFKLHQGNHRMKITTASNYRQIMPSKIDGYKKESINKRAKLDKYTLHPFANKAAARMILIDANYRSNPHKSFSISSILRCPQYLKKQEWSSEKKANKVRFSKYIDVFCTEKYQPLYVPKEITFNYTREEINKMKKILDKDVKRIDSSEMSFHEHYIYKLEKDLALRMKELQAKTKRIYTSGTKLIKRFSGIAITSKDILVDKKYSNQMPIRKYHVLTKLQDKKLTEKNNYTDLRQLKGEINSLGNLRKTQWKINNFYKWHKLNNVHNVQLTLKRSYSHMNDFLSVNNKITTRGSIRLKSTRSSTNIAAESGKIKVPLNKEIFLPNEKEISSEEFYPDTVNASKYINQDYDEEDRKSVYKEDEEDSKSAYRDNEEDQEQYYPKNKPLTLKDMMNMGINDLRRKLFHLEPERYDDDSDDAKSNDYREYAEDDEDEKYSRKGYKRYIKKLKREGLIPKDFKKHFKLPEKAEYLDETEDEPTNEEDNYSGYYRQKSADGPKKETYYSRYEKKADDTWNKVVNYFKAMPGVPSADEFKKIYYRKRAEKYAKLAGLIVIEKEVEPENLSTNESPPTIVAHPLVAESTDQENNKDELHLKHLLPNFNKQHRRSYSTLSENNYHKLLHNTKSEKIGTLEQLRKKTYFNNGRCYSTSAQNQLNHAEIPVGKSFHPISKDFFENPIKSSMKYFDPEVVSQESVDSDDEKTVAETPGEQKESNAESVPSPSKDKKCCSEYTGNNLNNIIRTIEIKERIFKSIVNVAAQYVHGVNFHNRRFSTSMINSSDAKKANLAESGSAPDSNTSQTENADNINDKSANPEVESVYSIDSDGSSETGVPVNQEISSTNTKEPSSSSDPIVNLISKRSYSKHNANEDLDAINKSLDEKDHQRLTENIVKSILEATTAQSQQDSSRKGEKTVVIQPKIIPRKMTLAEIIFSEPKDEYEKYFKATCLAAFLDIFRKTEMLSDANFEETGKHFHLVNIRIHINIRTKF